MSIFSFEESLSIGEVRGVDTSSVFIQVTSIEKLCHVRVGRLVAIQGRDINEWLIGMVDRVWRNPLENDLIEGDVEEIDTVVMENNSTQVTLVGTYQAKRGDINNYFTRALLSLPDINRHVFPIEGKALEEFMSIISCNSIDSSKIPLEIGTYMLDRRAKAFIDGDKLFQRHAALLGSTGSGKSWTVATILEQASKLDHANIVVFDLHGEYKKLPYAQQLRLAGPSDLKQEDDSVLYLPFWLLNYDEIQSMFIDRTENSAPNQATAVLDAITRAKKETLTLLSKKDVLDLFTVDSPIPYKMKDIIEILEEKNSEEIGTGEKYQSGAKKGQDKTVQGPLYNKLTRLLIRIKNRIEDRRYGFLFQPPEEWYKYEALHELAYKIMGYRGIKDYGDSGVKVIDFSEVPSDVLPVIVSLTARLIFQIQFWSDPGEEGNSRHPILLVCDEAHLYLPNGSKQVNVLENKALENFERIAKEGRKYGVGLFVVSQRPSDVSTTILTQCNNVIALRLSNDRDKAVVKGLVSDTLSGLLNVLPSLEVGEAIVVGDSVLLPTRICLNKPTYRPLSTTIDFWQRWEKHKVSIDIEKAVENLRIQSRKE